MVTLKSILIFQYFQKKANSNDYELLPKHFMRDKCLRSSERSECEKWFSLVAGNGQYERVSKDLPMSYQLSLN